ncbi:unnamed protein product, partial [Scytosiphon promiscuus]
MSNPSTTYTHCWGPSRAGFNSANPAVSVYAFRGTWIVGLETTNDNNRCMAFEQSSGRGRQAQAPVDHRHHSCPGVLLRPPGGGGDFNGTCTKSLSSGPGIDGNPSMIDSVKYSKLVDMLPTAEAAAVAAQALVADHYLATTERVEGGETGQTEEKVERAAGYNGRSCFRAERSACPEYSEEDRRDTCSGPGRNSGSSSSSSSVIDGRSTRDGHSNTRFGDSPPFFSRAVNDQDWGVESPLPATDSSGNKNNSDNHHHNHSNDKQGRGRDAGITPTSPSSCSSCSCSSSSSSAEDVSVVGVEPLEMEQTATTIAPVSPSRGVASSLSSEDSGSSGTRGRCSRPGRGSRPGDGHECRDQQQLLFMGEFPGELSSYGSIDGGGGGRSGGAGNRIVGCRIRSGSGNAGAGGDLSVGTGSDHSLGSSSSLLVDAPDRTRSGEEADIVPSALSVQQDLERRPDRELWAYWSGDGDGDGNGDGNNDDDDDDGGWRALPSSASGPSTAAHTDETRPARTHRTTCDNGHEGGSARDGWLSLRDYSPIPGAQNSGTGRTPSRGNEHAVSWPDGAGSAVVGGASPPASPLNRNRSPHDLVQGPPVLSVVDMNIDRTAECLRTPEVTRGTGGGGGGGSGVLKRTPEERAYLMRDGSSDVSSTASSIGSCPFSGKSFRLAAAEAGAHSADEDTEPPRVMDAGPASPTASVDTASGSPLPPPTTC